MKIRFDFLSLQDREGMEPDNFGDPIRRLFPIMTQEDVDKAPKRIRRAAGVDSLKDRIIGIAKRKGFKLPDEWATLSEDEEFSEEQLATFSVLSKADRKKLKKSDFGDPERLLYPIMDQSDVNAAARLIGKAHDPAKVKKRIIAIAKRKGFKIPNAWKETAKMAEFAEFALDTNTVTKTSDGEYVLRTGKIFEAGDYKDKNFQISPEELLEAIDDFRPVDLDLEHMPTILDGKLGKLEAVALGDNGWDLIGTVRLPKWLDSQLGDGERKVSATWDRETKKLTKLALVRNPRVADAALMAAFAANEIAGGTQIEELVKNVMTHWFEENAAQFAKQTYDGMSVMQSIHDRAASAGAVCKEPEKKTDKKSEYSMEEFLTVLGQKLEESDDDADFVSATEAKLIQQIHDTAMRGGAKCTWVGEGSYPAYYNKTDSESDNNNKENEKMSIKALKKFFMDLPDDFDPSQVKNADTEDDAGKEAPKEEPKAEPAPAPAAPAPAEPAPAAPAASEVENSADKKSVEPSAREKELEAELAKLRANEIKRDAEAFADAEIKAERAFPAERETLVSLFSQAAKDDAASKVDVAFKNGEEDTTGSRVDALKALYAVRKPHNLTKEELVGMGAGVLNTETGDNTDYVAEAEKQAREYASRRNTGKAK